MSDLIIKDKSGELVMLISAEEAEVIRKYFEVEAQFKAIQAERREIIKQYMINNDIKSYENDDIRLTYIAPHKRKTVDTNKLKEQGLYEMFLKETDVSDSIKFEVKYE